MSLTSLKHPVRNPRAWHEFAKRCCLVVVLCVLSVIGALPAQAQARGPVTNLPLPRYVSLKASEGNVRRGPSMAHRIDWVYTRHGMPLQIVAEYEHWRKIVDIDGVGGWIHYSLLSGNRSVIVQSDITLRNSADEAGTAVAQFEANVIARLRRCEIDWCEIVKDGHRGWAPKAVLWGVEADEVFD